MSPIKLTSPKWYHCRYCLNYSFEPKHCCGHQMIEEVEGIENSENDYNESLYRCPTNNLCLKLN